MVEITIKSDFLKGISNQKLDEIAEVTLNLLQQAYVTERWKNDDLKKISIEKTQQNKDSRSNVYSFQQVFQSTEHLCSKS